MAIAKAFCVSVLSALVSTFSACGEVKYYS